MGAAPDRHVSVPQQDSAEEPFRQGPAKPMARTGSSGLSLVTGANKSGAWKRSIFNADFGFRGLMLLAALAILVIVALIIEQLLQLSLPAWHKFGIHFFFGTELLAAIPSVIYGLWAIFVLVPLLRVYVDP